MTKEKSYRGFWRPKPHVTTSTGWNELPGVFPAGGDEPTDDPALAAQRFATRLVSSQVEGVDEIEVRLFNADGETNHTLRRDLTPKWRLR